LKKSNRKKIPIKPIKILKKPAVSVSFYKPEIEKTKPNPNKKTKPNRQKNEPNQKNRAKPV